MNIPQNLQHSIAFYPTFLEENHRPFVGAPPQSNFPEEISKILGQQPGFARPATTSYAPGPKSCAQCGTTRTPQWREGPEGPKTLCNACGVKRVRQMRTHLDGSKRRNTKASPAYKQEANLQPTEDYFEARELPSKRPLRKAAAKAAAKTADFANRGEWGEEEEEYSFHSSQETGSADSAGHNSDSAEEVAWVPERHTHPRHIPPSPMSTAVGPECAAAVNLLSMSVHDSAVPAAVALGPALGVQRTASGDSARDVPKISAASYAQMANSALKWNCHLPCHAKAQEQIQEALRQLPAGKQVEMLVIKDELDAVSREAAAADAAVAAVAKILAMKQVAAIKARAAAAQAAKRTQRYMISLDEEYGWSKQAPKKHRFL